MMKMNQLFEQDLALFKARSKVQLIQSIRYGSKSLHPLQGYAPDSVGRCVFLNKALASLKLTSTNIRGYVGTCFVCVRCSTYMNVYQAFSFGLKPKVQEPFLMCLTRN